MDTSKFLDLPSELLLLWHAHRLEIVLSAGILLACVRLAIHWRQRSRSKVALTPPLGSPVDEKLPLALIKEELREADHYEPILTPIIKPAKAKPKRVTGVKRTKSSPQKQHVETATSEKIQPLIFYFSLGGSTKIYAERLQHSFQSQVEHQNKNQNQILPPILHDLTQIDYDDYFVSPPKPQPSNTPIAYVYTLLIPSYDISTEIESFIERLKETHYDFRIDTAPLRALAGYSVFAFGDQEGWKTEEAGFCKDAIEVDKWMARLTGGKRAWPLGLGDVKSDAGECLEGWSGGVRGVVADLALGKALGEGVAGSGDAVESGDEGEEEDVEATTAVNSKRKAIQRSRTSDLEDLKAPTPIPVDFTTTTLTSLTTPATLPQPLKPMVPKDSPTFTSLTKQGYTIVGTHSGVKTCRWTKSALRGRGSCYKYSFYGIASHLCMEATPSLSCSNKCVFCWRHGTNPVSTTWKWTVDEPELVFDGMREGHLRKIRALRGVPGVRSERFQEAMRIRHCALSLVGEPIFYPHINRLLALLHGERISTFLVCNAQHPDHLEALDQVTQLYVSIDASNKESLKKIDRPLHRDFWERFLRCMDIIRSKRFSQRTVFRLTLVKGFNIEAEAEGYAALVERALPGFVEVKGVTYCGTSSSAGAGLSMQNVPFYEEVKDFVRALEAALGRRGLEYGIAAEHAHSCCVLLADKGRFYRPRESEGGERKWHTLISYEKFFECLESGRDFGAEDYIGAETPEWALWGRGGFDPRDERVDRKGRPVVGRVEETVVEVE